MKKLLALAMVAAAIISTTGCSGGRQFSWPSFGGHGCCTARRSAGGTCGCDSAEMYSGTWDSGYYPTDVEWTPESPIVDGMPMPGPAPTPSEG